jgi:hypothetical protein
MGGFFLGQLPCQKLFPFLEELKKPVATATMGFFDFNPQKVRERLFAEVCVGSDDHAETL